MKHYFVGGGDEVEVVHVGGAHQHHPVRQQKFKWDNGLFYMKMCGEVLV